MKKAQVTIFIIIAILLVSSVGLVFVVKNSLNIANVPAGSESVYNAFFSCLEEVGDAAVFVVLAQGGTYEKGDLNNPKSYKLTNLISNGSGIEKSQYVFTKESVEKSTVIFFGDFFDNCIDSINFNKFSGEIIFNDFNLDVNVKDKFILMDLEFPITIKKEDSTLNIKDFSYRKDIDFKTMESTVNKIVDGSIDLNFPPFDDLENIINQQKNINLSMIFVENQSTLVQYLINFQERYNVTFIIEHDW